MFLLKSQGIPPRPGYTLPEFFICLTKFSRGSEEATEECEQRIPGTLGLQSASSTHLGLVLCMT